MPIKFRCDYCRQLLGISRSKAGQIVDCPTCGRVVRVPELDGRREPVPEPEMNLADSELTGALAELARIGQQPIDDAEPDSSPQSAQVIEPEPLPAPEPIDPPAASGPLAGSIVPPSPPGSVEQRRPGRKPVDRRDQRAAAYDDELASLAIKDEGLPIWRRRAMPGRRKWRTLFPLPVILTICGVALIGFLCGYLVGDTGSHPDVTTTQNPSGGPAATETTQPSVKGHITFKNEEGQSRQDRRARVIAFPQQRQGQRKLGITGFRSGDSDSTEDFRSARAALRELGGAVAVADDDGNFELSLPATGTYSILVLSHYQPRDEDEPIEAPLMKLLNEYFDRPEQLLGRVAYHFTKIQNKGTKSQILDHLF